MSIRMYTWKINLAKNIKMSVVCHYKVCVGIDSTINKFIIISILINQAITKVDIGIGDIFKFGQSWCLCSSGNRRA